MKNRAGEYKTNLSGDPKYKSFIPSSLLPDPVIVYDHDIILLLSKANNSLGILEGMSRQISDIDLFVSMFV